MSYISCCNKNYKARCYELVPKRGFKRAILKISFCPACKSFLAEIIRTDFKDNECKPIRQKGDKAFELIGNVEHDILFKISQIYSQNGKFYLNYNEYGRTKKCFSNLSTLKLGRLHSNFEDIERSKVLLV